MKQTRKTRPGRADAALFGATFALTVLAGAGSVLAAPALLVFVASGLALGLLASIVGRAVDALGDRLGAAGTGILQSALGNLPELLVIGFALHRGLTTVVHATLVGSILANVALVLGLAFICGGLKHGTQRFDSAASRDLGLMLLLATAALAVPSLTAYLHTPAAGHERALTVVVAAVMLAAFALSIPVALSRKDASASSERPHAPSELRWSLAWCVGVLTVSGVLAALVSDWFVSALEPAMRAVHISEAFAGLVIVAIAGNAVENVVGVQLALRNQPDYALQVTLQSPLQVALVVAPVIVFLSPLLGAPGFTLVLPPLLLAALVMSALLAAIVTFDGTSSWYEGAVLVGLYIAVSAAFWWG